MPDYRSPLDYQAHTVSEAKRIHGGKSRTAAVCQMLLGIDERLAALVDEIAAIRELLTNKFEMEALP